MTAPVLLHLQSDVPDADISHLPGLLSRRLMQRVVDYTYAAAGGKSALLVAEFDGIARAQAGAGAFTEGSAEVNVFEQISPASGWLTATGVEYGPVRPSGSAVLSVIMDVERAALDDFHGWYEEEHLPKLVQVSGILCAQRFTTADPPSGGRARFLAWYEMANTGVVASAEFAEASILTPRTAAVTPHLSWASQLYRDTPEGAA